MPNVKVHHLVTIGDKYAYRLGYEDLVGSTGIVTDVLSVTSEVLILSSKNKENLFKQFTIHIDDCIVDKKEEDLHYFAVDLSTGRIYFSKNKDMIEYLWNIEFNEKQYSMADKPVDITEIVDLCDRLPFLKRYKDTFGYEYVLCSLDEPLDNRAKVLRKLYEQHKAQQNNELNMLAAKLAIHQFERQMESLGIKIKWDIIDDEEE